MAEARKQITVKGICKSFQNQEQSLQVLQDVTLDVNENEFLVILGPGQCGKTVLLNILAGLESADSGTVEFANGTPKYGEIGFVFQRYALFPWKTVLQNVEMHHKFQRVPKKERREQAMHFIRLVGLDGFENAYPAQLSGGMKQRVGIARAYATRSNIILMDEPFGALDAQTRYQMQDEILKIRSAEKTTVIFVTNNIEEAVTLGDRILLMSNKPSSIVREYVPELPRPRQNTDRAFMDLRNVIAQDMDLAL